MTTLTPRDPAHEAIYYHFVERQDNGQFDRYNPDMQSFVNRVWNKNLGTVAAMSHSGIGGDVTNGFVQFVTNDPIMFMKLIEFLTEVRDVLPRSDQPSIEIRSKTTPNGIELGDSDATHYLTVMMRSPRFKNKNDANRWWAQLVQSYN